MTESGYPTGSTFKPVTALAALEGGLINPSTTINDTGHLKIGTQEYQNAKEASFGTINVVGRAEGLLGHLLLPARRAGPTTATT